MKQYKRFIMICALFVCAIFLLTSQTEAKRAPRKVKITKISVKSTGKTTVSFNNKVKWDKDASVTVTDGTGKAVGDLKVTKKSKKSLVFTSETLKNAGSYTLTIKGIKTPRSKEFETVNKSFKVKAKKLTIGLKKIKARKTGVSIEFKHKVSFKDGYTVIIKDADGKVIESSISHVNKKSIRLKTTTSLERDKSYTVTISAIKREKESDENYRSIMYSFKRR